MDAQGLQLVVQHGPDAWLDAVMLVTGAVTLLAGMLALAPGAFAAVIGRGLLLAAVGGGIVLAAGTMLM
jgi:uncharacterized membrane-anchored protein